MSYEDSYGRGGGGSDGRQGYGRQQDVSEYGGGGRGSDSYYNQQSSYSENSSGYQGGSEYQSGSNYQQSGHDDYQGALSHAQQHSSHQGGNPEESNIFANALGFLAGNKHNLANENIDEPQAINAHQAMYGESQHHQQQQQQQHSSETVGAGAALQALKMFTGGGAGAGGQGSQGGGNSQNKLIGLAMAQASSLFDQQSKHGKVVSFASFLLLPLPIIISPTRSPSLIDPSMLLCRIPQPRNRTP